MYPSLTAVSLPSFTPLRIPLLWISLFLAATLAQMPYNPTRILHNGSRVYVFRPSASSTTQFELGSIDISSKIASSDLPYTTLYPTLPFLSSEKNQPFDAALDHDGNITVYTGDCAMGTDGGQLWKFFPDRSGKSGNGSWIQNEVAFAQHKHTSTIVPNYLSAGMSFSPIVGGDVMATDTYFFGGMCPFGDGGGAGWQSNANYSNYMVTLEPTGSPSGPMQYQLDVSTSRGPPIAEAGFTLTGLSPTFSNRSDGTQIQQQNFVLVGGHTNAAFINTSQVALFSLPQQGWTFVPVAQPDTSATAQSIQTDVATVEPRSGHSAVLTPDGQRIVIFGGWIGDTDNPASPQLAVLNIGDGYGGEGNWEWTVPVTSGLSLPQGSGVYGHGAAMLPGGVMMIMGGYPIAASGSRRRRASPNPQPMFFNVSSYTWMTDYSPPPEVHAAQPDKTGPLTTTTQKVGLGAGLGIGVAAVLGLMAFYIWYTRKVRRQRALRESQLQDLAMGAHRYTLSPGYHGDQEDYTGSPGNSYFASAGARQGAGWRRTDNQDAERTGLLVEIPSPTRGLRRGLSARPSHHMSRYDDRRTRGSGHIHPIDEEEEQEQEQEAANDKTPLTSQPEMVERSSEKKGSIFDNAPVLDPFVDRGRLDEEGSLFHSLPESPVKDEDDELHPGWQAAAEALLGRNSSPSTQGRVSPTKSSERTGSNLSDRSTRSNLSSRSGTGSLGRSTSMRSAAILNHAAAANPFKTPDLSPTVDAAARNGNAWQSHTDPRTRSFTSIRSNGHLNTANADADSFTTARSSFMVLQAEGEALLGGNPERARPGTSSTSTGSNTHSYRDTEGTTSRADTGTGTTSLTDGPTRKLGGRERRMSWLGSVRKALTRSTSAADRTRSLTSATNFESYTDDPRSESPHHPSAADHPSKRKSLPASNPPRRAASDASFWKSKRGKQDWVDEELEMDPSDPRAKWRRTSGDDWGAPEDLHLAEQERLRAEWRRRGSLLINLSADDDEQLPTPRTPIHADDLGVGSSGVADRPLTPADEEDWDVEAAVERRVVQVMFTVPKSKLRVVNADVERSSILSLPRENSDDTIAASSPPPLPGKDSSASPGAGRVRDIAGRFEQLAGSSSSPSVPASPTRQSPRASPRPSPAPSIRSLKIRGRNGAAEMGAAAAAQRRRNSAGQGRGGVHGHEDI